MSHYDLHRDVKVAEHMWQDALVNLYMAVRENLHSNPYIVQTHAENVQAMERKYIAAKQAWTQAQQEAA